MELSEEEIYAVIEELSYRPYRDVHLLIKALVVRLAEQEQTEVLGEK